jgi:hypothetical protein
MAYVHRSDDGIVKPYSGVVADDDITHGIVDAGSGFNDRVSA